ncbi:hypothetical protein RGQ21_68190 [Kitasatospora aureofaciens]|nr:hypothetical protein RGQ21_68190 [Kitasatospora aureofaciens]
MAPRPLNEIVEAGWAKALEPVAGRITSMGEFLRAEIAAGRTYLPAGANVLRAFQQPFDDVRVLIVGQDPYPTPGHAKVPRTLYSSDTDLTTAPPVSGGFSTCPLQGTSASPMRT